MVPESHCRLLADLLSQGKVVPFLGAGAALCGRPSEADDSPWEYGATYLPDGRQLANYLAKKAYYDSNDVHDLLRVAQYARMFAGESGLYDWMREIFASEYEPNRLHTFLARLPQVLRDKGWDPPAYQTIVTTNYDDLLEKAFVAAGEPYDLLWYIAEGSNTGRLWHRAHGQEPRVIEDATSDPLSPDKRTMILKIHGAVDRADSARDSYVITEDHYIEYLTRADLGSLLPAKLGAKLVNSRYLFLGYSLRDWNMRVILHRIWEQQQVKHKSWTVQRPPTNPEHENLDEKLWKGRGDVETIYVELEEYISALEPCVNELEPHTPSAQPVPAVSSAPR
jgi:NAD-dependent SIR2 family protein deacetylase